MQMNTFFTFLSTPTTRVALGTLAVTYSFTQKVGTVCQVKGSSMEPTFSNDDWVYIGKEGSNLDKATSSSFYKKIKSGFVWVEGDNSKVSKDSNAYGPVPISCVEGKVWGKLYPRNKSIQKKFEISEDKYFLKAD